MYISISIEREREREINMKWALKDMKKFDGEIIIFVFDYREKSSTGIRVYTLDHHVWQFFLYMFL